MIANRTENTPPLSFPQSGREAARRPGRFFLLGFFVAFVLVITSGCAADSASLDEIFPLLPAALNEAPPPGIEVLVEIERMRLFGLESAQNLASQIEAERAKADLDDTSVTPPDVTAFNEAVAREAGAEESSAATVELPAVTVSNRSVNVRSGPGLDFTVVAGADEGTSFEVIGRSEDEGWWRICCVRGADDGPEEATQKAWIADIVVTANETAYAQPILGPIYPEDLQARWNVSYACGSERCEVSACSAAITAEARSTSDPKWLEIERKVTWADSCGEDSIWLHQIDRTEGIERYDNASDFFLFNFWAGVEPGPLNSLFSLNSEEQVRTWCSDEQELELEEGDGWSALYTGVTCHDFRTGMLVSMKYTKRWLFTGTYEGEAYDHAYFGDYEVYEVRLDDTNVELAYVNPSQAAVDEASGAEPTP